jgi:erythromycin esterase
VIVWAHNGHINKGSLEFAGMKLLGGRLSEEFGSRYYAIATAFYEGDVRAQHAKEGVIVNTLPPARAGSIDSMLNALDGDAWFANLADVRQTTGWANILTDQGVLRGVGGAYEPENDSRTYRPTNLAVQFDAVIFIRRVSASTPL